MREARDQKKWIILGHLIGKELEIASQKLKGRQSKYHEQLAKYQQLKHYHQEYKVQAWKQINGVISGTMVENYENFLKNLDDILVYQGRMLERVQSELEQVQSEWSVVYLKQKNFREYREKQIKKDLLAEERRLDRNY